MDTSHYVGASSSFTNNVTTHPDTLATIIALGCQGVQYCSCGGTVVQWLVLSSHSEKFLGSVLGLVVKHWLHW